VLKAGEHWAEEAHQIPDSFIPASLPSTMSQVLSGREVTSGTESSPCVFEAPLLGRPCLLSVARGKTELPQSSPRGQRVEAPLRLVGKGACNRFASPVASPINPLVSPKASKSLSQPSSALQQTHPSSFPPAWWVQRGLGEAELEPPLCRTSRLSLLHRCSQCRGGSALRGSVSSLCSPSKVQPSPCENQLFLCGAGF